MLRRNFVGMMGLFGVGSLVSLAGVEEARQPSHSGKHETVKYAVAGFTCITCAVGLETLLRREKGVLFAKVDYPSGTATVEFDPERIGDPYLRSFIENAGFRAAKVPR